MAILYNLNIPGQPPVVWEEETKEELIDSAGRGLRTREERDRWRRGREGENKTPEGWRFLNLSKFC